MTLKTVPRDNSTLYYNPKTNANETLISTTLPTDQLLWSPRMGFNWDVNGEKTTQIRGGSGILLVNFHMA
jgi:hypothetical protein